MEEKNRNFRDGNHDWIEFSVILIAYNLERYLRKTIQSVLDQEFKNFELIIVDDGSTDGSLHVAESFQDPRINVISQKNGGASDARNAGLKAAKGKYVAFLDGDDYWYPDHLKMAFNFFRKYPEVHAYAAKYAWEEEGFIPRREETPCSFVLRKLGLRGLLFMHSSSVVLNASLVSRLPLWEADMKYGEDILYWVRLMRRAAVIGLGKRVGSIYVQRAGSAMHDQAYRDISVEDLLGRLLEEWKLMPHRQWQFAVHFLIVRELHPSRLLKMEKEARFRFLKRIGPMLHGWLEEPCFNAYVKTCLRERQPEMEKGFERLLRRVNFCCVWADRVARWCMRSCFFK
ncbi:MAG: glycosyltransferase family 2 protein [Akkermansia muciniphila]|uniref:glycosyltransferase family 2 protein n=1 Tax=uncultured Akkermansia sp. TaxID=512294 RepID=UPI00262CAAC8|nr:glycosyltransferase family 2 protein [uncultured Akkermansia sp.]